MGAWEDGLMYRSKILVTERRRSWDRNYIKGMVSRLVTTVAGVGQQHITLLKLNRILLPDCPAQLRQRRVDHGNQLRFRPVAAISFDGFHRLADLVYLEFCQRP